MKLLPVIVDCFVTFYPGIGYFWRICNQKVFSERCDFVFSILVKSANSRTFRLLQNPSCLSLKETMPFFSFHLKAVEHFSILLAVCSLKMFTNCLQRQWSLWKPGPNFLERPLFFGRICRFEKVLPRMGRMSYPRHYHDLSKKSPRSTVLVIQEMLECLQQEFTDLQTRQQVYKSVVQMFATVYNEFICLQNQPRI